MLQYLQVVLLFFPKEKSVLRADVRAIIVTFHHHTKKKTYNIYIYIYIYIYYIHYTRACVCVCAIIYEKRTSTDQTLPTWACLYGLTDGASPGGTAGSAAR